MEICNIYSQLEKAPLDSKAGIKLIKLTGDCNISVYAAEISANTKLNPHYHKKGIETYQILSGNGIMNIGSVNNGHLIWDKTIKVEDGDCFSIEEGKVHQLINITNQKLTAIFTCSESHLNNDRYFV